MTKYGKIFLVTRETKGWDRSPTTETIDVIFVLLPGLWLTVQQRCCDKRNGRGRKAGSLNLNPFEMMKMK